MMTSTRLTLRTTHTHRNASTCSGDADLTLLPLLGEDVTDQSLLEDFLFDQEVPQPSSGEGEVVLCPAVEGECVRYSATSVHHTSNSY